MFQNKYEEVSGILGRKFIFLFNATQMCVGYIFERIYYFIYKFFFTRHSHASPRLSLINSNRGKRAESDNKLLAISLIVIFQINKLDWNCG